MIAMNVPFITWCVIVFAVVALISVRVISHLRESRKKSMRHIPLFSIGREREEFFVPGDKPIYSKDDFDDPYDD